MKSAGNRHETWREAGLGYSHGFGVCSPLSAPRVDLTEGRAHPRRAGIGRKPAVAAGPVGVATLIGPLIPIALRDQLSRVERGCLLVLPGRIRRAAAPTWRLALPFAGDFKRLPAGGRSRSRRCALGRQTEPRHQSSLSAIVGTRHSNSRRALTSRDGSKPLWTDPCFREPTVQSHFVEHLSSVAGHRQQHSERQITRVQEVVASGARSV